MRIMRDGGGGYDCELRFKKPKGRAFGGGRIGGNGSAIDDCIVMRLPLALDDGGPSLGLS